MLHSIVTSRKPKKCVCVWKESVCELLCVFTQLNLFAR